MQQPTVITVSQLNSYIKVLFESDKNLKNIFLCGEISNFKKHYPTGHLYFSLKDEFSVLRAVMFHGSAKNLSFDLQDGMSVVVRGFVSCYEVSGQYQIYVEDVRPEGFGSVYLAFEQLKQKLLKEGLFDESIKKLIPRYPIKIGVITSPTGAVIYDIKKVLEKRYPVCEVVLYPVKVQGENSAEEIVQAIKYLNKYTGIDVIILGRGGGSAEDLWAFNKESIAREIFKSDVPIISAVWHESDFTICYFVADKRAPTPSAAAEMAAPDKEEIKCFLKEYNSRVEFLVESKLNECSLELSLIQKNLKNFSPKFLILNNRDKVIYFSEKINNLLKFYLSEKAYDIKNLMAKIKLYSPALILSRGYAAVFCDGKSAKSVKDVHEGKDVKLQFADGFIEFNLSKIDKRGAK